MKVFSKDSDSYNRSAIRYIRCLLELEKIDLAISNINTLTKSVKIDSKTGVHLLQLQAKISFQQGKFQECNAYIDQALPIAKFKAMITDIQRLEDLKQKALLYIN